jgi:hypothetical protein
MKRYWLLKEGGTYSYHSALKVQITNSVEYNPSWDADSRSGSQDIPHLL